MIKFAFQILKQVRACLTPNNNKLFDITIYYYNYYKFSLLLHYNSNKELRLVDF